MKLCEIKNQREVSYPVGDHIKSAIEFVDKVVEKIQTEKLFPTDKECILWCRGSSGSILATLLASKMTPFPIIRHIKKPLEESHSTNKFSSSLNHYNIIIDDFVASGDTIRAIALMMSKAGIEEIDCIILSGSNVHSEKTEGKVSYVGLNFPTPHLLITGGYVPSKRLLKKLLTTNLFTK